MRYVADAVSFFCDGAMNEQDMLTFHLDVRG